VPVLAGSALQNTGVNLLMSAINGYLPSPAGREIKAAQGVGEITMKPAKEGPLAALVFKNRCRPVRRQADLFPRLFRRYRLQLPGLECEQKHRRAYRTAVSSCAVRPRKRRRRSGRVDIGAVAKLSQTVTGDTICSKDKVLKLTPVIFPVPISKGPFTRGRG